MAQTAYGVAHPTTSWPVGSITGAQIKLGNLANDSAAELTDSVTGFATSGIVTIDASAGFAGATPSSGYTQAWTVYDSVLGTYSDPVVGTVTTAAAEQHATGGASAVVTVSAEGAGTAVELASGGADAVVGVIATGSGVAIEAATDGATSAIQATATGSGTALEAALGGSSAQIMVTATGAGFKEASSLPVLSLGTFVPGSILSTGLRGRVTATASI